MTDTISYKPILVQHGIYVFTDLLSTWNYLPFTAPSDLTETETFTVFANPTIYRQLYDFEVTFDSERNLPLDVPNFFTQDSQSLYFNLTFPTNITSIISTMVLGFEAVVDPISRPNTEVIISNFNAKTNLRAIENPLDSSRWDLTGATYDLTFPLDFNTETSTITINAFAFTPPGNTKVKTIQSAIKPASWNGRIALTFTSFDASTWDFTIDPSDYNRGFLTGQYVPFHTGWENRPASRGRPVRDMKTGLPAFAEDLVEDGFKPGIWTSSAQWDPIDPRDVRPVEFPDEEGVKTDDVPV